MHYSSVYLNAATAQSYSSQQYLWRWWPLWGSSVACVTWRPFVAANKAAGFLLHSAGRPSPNLGWPNRDGGEKAEKLPLVWKHTDSLFSIYSFRASCLTASSVIQFARLEPLASPQYIYASSLNVTAEDPDRFDQIVRLTWQDNKTKWGVWIITPSVSSIHMLLKEAGVEDFNDFLPCYELQ